MDWIKLISIAKCNTKQTIIDKSEAKLIYYKFFTKMPITYRIESYIMGLVVCSSNIQ